MNERMIGWEEGLKIEKNRRGREGKERKIDWEGNGRKEMGEDRSEEEYSII